MEIAYNGRHEQKEKPYRYFADGREMAEWADVLMLSCPGGKETHHLIDAGVLAAHDGRMQRHKLVGDLRPLLGQRLAEYGGMTRAERRHECVVIDRHQLRSPAHRHREAGRHHQADRERQPRRPVFPRTERRLRPVCLVEQPRRFW